MENIDLTLRGEFMNDSKRVKHRFEDERSYTDKNDYKDQRRAKLSILNFDMGFFNFPFTIEYKKHLEFFGEKENKDWDFVKDQEKIYEITGIMTSDLKLEYDAGFGSEDKCDCCGSFLSSILNQGNSYLCTDCERSFALKNDKFWESKFSMETNWID